MNWSNEESVNKLLVGVLIAAIFILGFNSLRLSNLNTIAPVASASPSASLGGAATGAVVAAASAILPVGVPAVYGKELSVSYDDVSAATPDKADKTIQKLGALDQKITLSGADKERYINILYILNNGISCEYCCGARAVIFADGQPACGCAHSYAMRGLTKYLITEHGNEYTDEQILEEAGKWKALFFPGPMELKAQVLQSKGIEVNYINLASNKYRGIEKGAAAGGNSGSGMVGGC